MSHDLFDLLEQTSRAGGPDAALDLLTRKLQDEKRHQLVFEVRLLRTRHALGLPLIFTGKIDDLPSEQRDAYQTALTEAAREAGASFLADGDIVRAWPYFRAIGEPAAVAAAIERVESREEAEQLLGIALVEGVSPRKGFELLLEHRGICQGVDFAISCGDRDNRAMFLRMLVKAFYQQLAANLTEAIAGVEGAAPRMTRVKELIAGRDWLFERGDFYIENSHLVSILQVSPELDDPETMRMALELACYAQRLDPIHGFEGRPPFENPFVDYAEYLRALMGERVEEAVAHFRTKVEEAVSGSAEVLIGLLARLGRYEEAIQISLERLGGEAGSSCPSAVQLCEMSGDYGRLRDVARREQNLLGFAAGIIHRASED